MKRLACVAALSILPALAHSQEWSGALTPPAGKRLAKKDPEGPQPQKDCHAAALKALKDIGQKDRVTWSAHFSATHQRCFMELSFHQTITSQDNRTLGHVWIHRLDDLLEHHLIAFSQTTDGDTHGIESKGWIPSKHAVTPIEAQEFIDKMMGR